MVAILRAAIFPATGQVIDIGRFNFRDDLDTRFDTPSG
jgi:hypothetical protein